MSAPSISSLNGEPIPHQAIIDAFGAASHLMGQTVQVNWSYCDRPQRRVWMGRLLGFDQGRVRIFYWRDQPGFPRLPPDTPGIELLLPREQVHYWQIRVVSAAPVSADQLRHAIEAMPEDLREDREEIRAANYIPENFAPTTQPPHSTPNFVPQENRKFNLADVRTWSLEDDRDARLLRGELALLTGFNVLTATPRILLAWQVLSSWTECAINLGGWEGIPSFTTMGDLAVRALRQSVAEDIHRIHPRELQARLSGEDNALDPFGRALTELKLKQRQSFQRRGGRTDIMCTKCGRQGHGAERCYAKTTIGKFGTGNGRGTGQQA